MIKNTKIIAGLAILAALCACATKPATTSSAPSSSTNSEAAANTLPKAATATTSAADGADQYGYATPNNNSRNAATTIVDPLAGQTLQTIGDRVFFETDKFTLSPEAREILGRQARLLIANPRTKVIIAGNCDERGTREYNLALGARRANSARDYLIGLGVSGSQIETVSYGKERPIDERPSSEGWAINRNAHTSNLN